MAFSRLVAFRTRAPWDFVPHSRPPISFPTSGNALEQVPKLVMTLSAGNLLAEDPGWGSALSIALVAALAAAAGAFAWRRFAQTRLPRYPAPAPRPSRPRRPLAKRVYVIVVDGLQPRPALAGGRAGHGPARARGHGVPGGRACAPGAHGRLLLLDAHRRRARRARHALELRAAPGRAGRVRVRRARAPRPQGPARGDRAPARPVRRGRRPLGHLGPADRADRPLARRRGPARGRGGGPGPARAPAARRRPARPRARRAQPRVPRADRGDRPPRGRLPRLPRGARQARRTRP